MNGRLIAAAALVLTASPLLGAADLWVTATHSPTRVPVGGMIRLEIYVSNHGPDIARNARVSFAFPAGLRLFGGSPLQNCDTSGIPIICTLGDLPPASPAVRIDFRLVAPPVSATVPVTATASSDTPDPQLENNSVTRVFEVVEAANLYPQVTLERSRVDPGSIVTATTSLSNFLDSDPRDIRIRYEVSRGEIISVEAPDGWSCQADGTSAECMADRLDPDCRCSRPIVLRVRTSEERAGGETSLTMVATSSLPEFYPPPTTARVAIESYRWFTVTHTGDGGAGSLRHAIEGVNSDAHCGTLPCKIAFEIDAPVPADGYFTIRPATALPPIFARHLFIDGATQTRFSGETNPAGPEIALDGREVTAGRGIEIHSACESAIESLAIGNFPDHAIVYSADESCAARWRYVRQIARCHIGVDPTGTIAWPNFRGLYTAGPQVAIRENLISGNIRSGIWSASRLLSASRNIIGAAADGTTPLPNGASGIYLAPETGEAEVFANVIAYNRQMGVAVDRAAQLVGIRQNSMRENGGLGIDIGLDGPDPLREDDRNQPNPPIVLSATYDEESNATTVTVTMQTRLAAALIDFYANDRPDGDGEQPIGARTWTSSTGATLTATFTGDYSGKWINATSTWFTWLFAHPPEVAADRSARAAAVAGDRAITSELSNTVLVMPR
jgi:hypothetical protein